MATTLRRSVALAHQFILVPRQFGPLFSSPRYYELVEIGFDAQGASRKWGDVYLHEGVVAQIAPLCWGATTLLPEKKSFVPSLEGDAVPFSQRYATMKNKLHEVIGNEARTAWIQQHLHKINGAILAEARTSTQGTIELPLPISKAMALPALPFSAGAPWGATKRNLSLPYIQKPLLHNSQSQRPFHGDAEINIWDTRKWVMDKLLRLWKDLTNVLKESADFHAKYKGVVTLVGSVIAVCYWVAVESNKLLQSHTANVLGEVEVALEHLRQEMVSAQLEMKKESLQLHCEMLKDLQGLVSGSETSRSAMRDEIEARENRWKEKVAHVEERVRILEHQVKVAAPAKKYYLF